MVSKTESSRIRKIVCDQLRDEPDLSTLTIGIIKKRYLAHVQQESLSPEAKHFMKQVVQEELIKMQDDNVEGSESDTKKLQNKRKRDEENDGSGRKNGSRQKKSRRELNPSSAESEDEDHKTSEESEDEKKSGSDEEKENKAQKNQKAKRRISSDDSSNGETNELENKGSEKEEMKKKASAAKNGKTVSGKKSEGKKTTQSDEEEKENHSRNDENNSDDDSDNSDKEEKVLAEKKNNHSESDSSPLPSLDDSGAENTKNKTEDKKTKTVKKEEPTKSQKEDNRAVLRLKRYIGLCGVRRNYKKLLSGCHSIRSQVATLKKELEDLGVQGQPTIKKCKKARLKREETEEVAELDVSNIIKTEGRAKRRGASGRQEQQNTTSPSYTRALNSGSDSDGDNNTKQVPRKTDWSNLRGIISDDADSD